MRRLAAALVVAAIAATLIAPAVLDAKPPPKDAVHWLGTWHTNFGTLYFHDLYYATSDVPDAHGNPQHYWALIGEWHHGDHAVTVHGAVSDPQYGTFSGCWTPPPSEGQTNCAQILIYRNNAGDRITGGYWKPCGLGANCADHHPWQGTKKEGAWKVRFTFTQRGYPDGRHSIRTQTGGAGALVYQHEGDAADGKGLATHDTRAFHIEEIPDASDLHLTIVPPYGRLVPGDRRTTLQLHGYVVKSDDSTCPPGSDVLLYLRDGRGGVPDQIRLHPAVASACHMNEVWTSSDKHRVNVTISGPHQTH